MSLLILIVSTLLLAIYVAYLGWRDRERYRALQQQVGSQLQVLATTQQQMATLQANYAALQQQWQQTQEDPITHLSGWRVFEDRLQQSIKESQRYQFTTGVLLIELDHFTAMQATYTDNVCNSILTEVGARLMTCIRQVDSISRFSQHTFIVLLTQLTKPETAVIVVQRMLQTIAEPLQIEDQELYLTASVGIAIYPSDGDEGDTLIQKAAEALQLAKENGKHTYQFYQAAMNDNSRRELALYTSLQNEMIYQELALYFQPIINVTTQQVVCMDTMLRWHNPHTGWVEQSTLLSEIAKFRKLNPLSEWLLTHACEQFMQWRTFDFTPPLLSVPISIKQLESSQFIYRMSQIMQEAQFNPQWLLLKIDEQTSALSFDVLEKAINMLHYLGVKIALDHFGSHAFSFAILKKMTIHFLKIDHDFIDDLAQNAQAVIVVETMVLLAKQLAVELIIDGVTNATQLQLLMQLGCQLMQGSFIAAPIAENEVSKTIVTPVS